VGLQTIRRDSFGEFDPPKEADVATFVTAETLSVNLDQVVYVEETASGKLRLWLVPGLHRKVLDFAGPDAHRIRDAIATLGGSQPKRGK